MSDRWAYRGEPPATPEGFLTPDWLWAAATDDSLAPGTGGELFFDDVTMVSGQMLVPQELLDDYGGFNMADLLGKLHRGEIKPVPREPTWHRCFACWLVAKLTKHTRCAHGYLESGCGECEMGYE